MTLTIDSQQFQLLEEYGVIETKTIKDKKTGEFITVITGINCPNLAKLLLYGDNRNYLILKDNQNIYYYNGSYFESNGEQILRNRINHYLDDYTTKHRRQETTDFIKSSGWIKREALDQPLNLINFKNGILNIETLELIPHNPEYTFLYELNSNYDKNAKYELWGNFVKEVSFMDDYDFIQEFCGFLLYRKYVFAIILILLGHGRNGKSTFINAIIEVLGRNNVVSIPLQTIAYNRFSKSNLYQKHANLCPDLGIQDIKDTGTLKTLTGQDPIYAERKHENGFEFINYAKQLFACNTLPNIQDNTLAMSERLAVVEFPNTFERGTDECDPYILEKITSENEKAGIINWMLEGLQRLLKNGNFSTYRDFENVTEYMKEAREPVAIFINTCLEHNIGIETSKNEIHKKYLEFCRSNNLPTLVSNAFSRKFKQYLPHEWNVDEGQTRTKGKTWKGIKFKNDGKNTTDIQQEGLF